MARGRSQEAGAAFGKDRLPCASCPGCACVSSDINIRSCSVYSRSLNLAVRTLILYTFLQIALFPFVANLLFPRPCAQTTSDFFLGVTHSSRMSVFTFELGRGSFPRPCGSVTYLTQRLRLLVLSVRTSHTAPASTWSWRRSRP